MVWAVGWAVDGAVPVIVGRVGMVMRVVVRVVVAWVVGAAPVDVVVAWAVPGTSDVPGVADCPFCGLVVCKMNAPLGGGVVWPLCPTATIV